MNKAKKIIYASIAGLWLASLAIAFVSGKNASSADSSDPASQNQEETKNKKKKTFSSSLIKKSKLTSKESTAATLDNIIKDTKTEWMEDAISSAEKYSFKDISEILQNKDPVKRTSSFMTLLENLDEHNVEDILAAFEAMPNRYERKHELELFFYAWGQADGESAMKYLLEQDKDYMRHGNMYNTLTGWASNDPEGAIAWAKENHESEDNPYMIGVINGIAQSDIYKASELMATLPYGRNRGKVVDILVKEFSQKNSEEAIRWAENIEEDTLRDGVITRLASSLSKSNPEEAANWILSNKDLQESKNVRVVADNWARKDPEAASEWVDDFDDPKLSGEIMSQVVRHWARKDITATGEWLNEYPVSEDRDRAVHYYIYAIREDSPETALLWAANGIENADSRKRLISQTMDRWKRRDPEEAMKFVEEYQQ